MKTLKCGGGWLAVVLGLACLVTDPLSTSLAQNVPLFDYSQVWRYNQTDILDSTGWEQPEFDDSGWPSGPGLLAFENNPGIVPLIGTTLEWGRTTYYFRTHFEVPDGLSVTSLLFSCRIDDGAVFYLNGVEVNRVRMTGSNQISYETLAAGYPPGGEALSDEVFMVDATWLLPGTNVLAVEVHQAALVSTDIVFGSRLEAVPTPSPTPPHVLEEPRSQTVFLGDAVSFSVLVSGAAPLSYQWFFNATNRLAGANGSVLTLSNVQPTNAGAYHVIVTNTLGAATSELALLTVLTEPPTILTQPSNQVVQIGGTVALQVMAEGSKPLWYQWRLAGTNLPGATGSNLLITGFSESQAGGYTVVVSNAFGSVTSAVAVLAVQPLVAWGYNGYGQCVVPAPAFNVVAVAAGGYHSLALRADGSVVGWGQNDYGQCDVPSGLGGVVAVAAGGYHSLALKADGTVIGWGASDYGQTAIPTGLANVVAVAAGWSHSLALKADGTLTAWGNNVDGEIAIPPGLANVVAVAAGGYHNLALKADGTVIAWGYNSYGQTAIPPGLSNVVAVTAGLYHSLVLKADGTLTAWGYDWTGQSTIPPGLANVVAVAAGGYHNLALKADGTVTAWGYSGDGQTAVPTGLSNVVSVAAGAYHSLALTSSGGLPSALSYVLQPLGAAVFSDKPVFLRTWATGLRPVSYQWLRNGVVLLGETSHLLTINPATVADSDAYRVVVSNAWGIVTSAVATVTVTDRSPFFFGSPTNLVVRPGNPATIVAQADGSWPLHYEWRLDGVALAGPDSDRLVFNAVMPRHGGTYSVVISNSFGSVTSVLATLTVLPVVGWGYDGYGQSNVPAFVGNTVAISVGANHNLALQADGTVRAWGRNNKGQTGVPFGLSGVAAVAASGGHSLALRTNGTVVAWGAITAPADLTNALGMSTRSDHCLAVRSDGTVAAWGTAYAGQAAILPLLTNVAMVAAGSDHALALRADGTVLAWGANGFGQTNVPIDLDEVVAVAAGGDHSLALKANGTVVAWGRNDYGQCNVPGNLSNVVEIAARGTVSLAVRADGKVVQWGYHSGYSVPSTLTNVVMVGVGDSHGLALVEKGSPFIAEPPVGGAVISGKTAHLRAWATGQRSMSFQWQCNGTNIPGATGHVLSIPDAPSGTLGRFRVVASNEYGTVTSGEASLFAIDVPPSVLIPPTNRVASIRGQAGFQVLADGSRPFGYQWCFNQAPIPGANGAQLTLTNLALADSGLYAVVVTNTFGAVTSAPAMLTVVPVVAWGLNTYGQFDLPASLSNAIAVVAGARHSLALKTDGTVAGWGQNYYGQTQPPPDLTNVIALAAGGSHSLALKADGTVVGWGENWSGQTNVPTWLSNVVQIAARSDCSFAVRSDGTVIGWGGHYEAQLEALAGLRDVVAIAAGGNHGLALKTDGTVTGWGDNDNGQIVPPPGLSDAVAIATGGNHSLALRADGTVVAWGANWYGQASVPTGLSNVVAIAARSDCSLALKADGTVVGWGYGNGDLTNAPPTLTNVVGISVGDNHCLAVVGTGTFITEQPAGGIVFSGKTIHLRTWAAGPRPVSYQWQRDAIDINGATNCLLLLADVTTNASASYRVVISNAWGVVTSRVAPVSVVFSTPFVLANPDDRLVSIGFTTNMIVAADGSWPLNLQWRHNGNNLAGQNGSLLVIDRAARQQTGVYDVVASNSFGSVTSAPGTLVVIPVAAWGEGWAGQNLLPTLSNAVAVAVGSEHNVALKSDGTVFAWGANWSGQCNVPPDLSNIVAVAAGGDHTLALRSDGIVVGWGRNDCSQATPPAGLINVVAVWARGVRSYALRADGTAVGWGCRFPEDPLVLGTLRNLVALAPGGNHCLALKSDGTVKVWGWNRAGQLDVPPHLSNVVAVAAGGDHCLALRRDGTLVAWGDNYYGQCSPPVGLSNVVAISARADVSLALQADGTVVGWGYRAYDQLDIPEELTSAMWLGVGDFHCLAVLNDGTPFIARSPYYQTVFTGRPAVFSVAVFGQSPLCYQWQFNGTNMAGATNAVLALENADFSSAGDYRVIVSNVLGVATSLVAGLTVESSAPFIASQPASTACHLGGSAEMHVVADGSGPLRYQWYFEEEAIPGATNDALALTNVNTNQAGNYWVAVSNSLGGTFSSFAQLLIDLTFTEALDAPGLAWTSGGTVPWFIEGASTHGTLLAAQSGLIGNYESSSLQTTVVGPGTLTFWWKVSSDKWGDYLRFYVGGGERASISGEKDWQPLGFYLPEGTNLLQWVYTKNSSWAMGQDAAWLDGVQFVPGNTAPIIVVQPAGQTNTAGYSMQLTVQASGPPILSYQWLRSGQPISGANYSTLSLGAAQPGDSGTYSVWVSNAYGVVFSSNATVVVTGAPPTIIVPLASQATALGYSVSMQVQAVGSPPLVYQWRRDSTVFAWASSSSFYISSAQYADAGLYSVLVSNAYGVVLNSNATLVVTAAPPFIVTQPADYVALEGNNFYFSVSARGSPPLSYQWRRNDVEMPGQQYYYLQFSPVVASNAGQYSVVVNNSFGSVTSRVATLYMLRPSQAAPVWQAGTGFHIVVDGAPGTNYVIEVSTNLSQWSPLRTNSMPPTGRWLFHDPPATNFLWRFYRSRTL